jgi:hypothetical protein
VRKTLRVLAASVVTAGAVIGAAAPSAAAMSAQIVDITLEECDIVVTFTVGDAGTYHVEVWDDGAMIGDVPVVAEAGATVQGRYTITAVVKQGASGLGIDITDGEGTFDSVDPYNGADHVIDFCAAQSTSTTTPPTTAPPPTTPTTVPVDPVVAPPATPVVVEPNFTG